MNCPHEDDITYGKQIDISETVHAVQILCATCGMVGTQIEHRDEEDHEHWQPEEEMWHQPSDYYRSDLAAKMTIALTTKTAMLLIDKETARLLFHKGNMEIYGCDMRDGSEFVIDGDDMERFDEIYEGDPTVIEFGIEGEIFGSAYPVV